MTADTQGERLARALREAVKGEVSASRLSRGLYATDASHYQLVPLAVCCPRDEEDVAAAVRIASEFGAPILPRGAGTSLSGQTVAEALVLDFSRHMRRVLEVNAEERWVRVQPGLVRDELNAAVGVHGLHFAPDPATANRCAVGGMIANNSSGMRSGIYGKTSDHVLGLRALLTNGEVLTCEPLDAAAVEQRAAAETREARILRGLRRVVDEQADEIRARYPKVMRRVGGYALDAFVDNPTWDLGRLLVGSEGTLATTLEARLRLEPLPPCTGLCVAHFAELGDAIRAVEGIVAQGPSAVELLDEVILRKARANLTTRRLTGFLVGAPGAVLVIECIADDREAVRERLQAIADLLRAQGQGYAWPILLDAPEQAGVWTVRKNGLGLMLGERGKRKPTAFIEDACVPLSVLPRYIDEVLGICRDEGVSVSLYAHAGVGVLHVRPLLDLKDAGDVSRMVRIANRALERVLGYGGAWSGEHGDGLVRSPFQERVYGAKLYAAFREVKGLFDPDGLMNPGKIVEAPPMDRNLRMGPGYREAGFPTWFHFRADGGFGAAVELCTGVGACRKTLGGTMCPSFMATRDEQDSTRARANALRLAMSGQWGPEGIAVADVYETLDLCLSCKACKAECPSNVDMARLKSEFLQHWHDRFGASRRERIVASTAVWAHRLAGPLAPLANAVQGAPWFRSLLERTVGFDARRAPPRFARQSFAAWFDGRAGTAASEDGRPPVVLFDDTFLHAYEPHVGRSVVELLEGAGRRVVRANAGCCQRTRISHGFLRDARRDGERTLRRLAVYAERGWPIVVVEPSCASALVDDLPDLVKDAALGEAVSRVVQPLETFLAAEAQAGRLRLALRERLAGVALHGHCHQKALFGTAAALQLLRAVPGLAVRELDTGCCGGAGSFGYEREHAEFSRRVAEDRFLPAIRALGAGEALVASGFSCRHQAADLANARARHWAEVLRPETAATL